MRRVIIHTDGGCRGNPGIGAWGAVIEDLPSHMKLEIGGGERVTTNNRMELSAAVASLKRLTESCEVTLMSDSTYVVKGMTQWIHGWMKRGWKKSDKKPVENRDLWEALQKAAERHHVRWQWVEGHAGHHGNERCDEIVNDIMDSMQSGGAMTYEKRIV
ncbi:MAG: ribonuclease HI [Spirochaetota bacterium]